MRALLWGSLVWLSGMASLLAAEVCVPIDRTTWTQDQKNFAHSVVFELSIAADPIGVKEPHDDQGRPLWINNTVALQSVCFTDPGFDVLTVITAPSILTQFSSDEAARQAVTTAENTRMQTLRDEIETNTLCTGTFAELDTRLETAIDAISNLAEVKAVLKNLLKRMARCQRARAEIPFR